MKKSSKSIIKENKKSFIITAVFVFLMLAFSFSQGIFANHGPNIFDGLTGWQTGDPAEDSATWGSNFGWVSFNHCNVAGNCGAFDFGASLEIDQSEPTFGNLSGHGWAGIENLGWITFDPTVIGPFEGADICGPQAKFSSTPEPNGSHLFSGWARAIVAPTGPNDFWNGCISMSGTTTGGEEYGVYYDPISGDIEGAAWGGKLIGWLNFATHTDPLAILNPGALTFVAGSSVSSPIEEGTSDTLTWQSNGFTSCSAVTVSPDPVNAVPNDWFTPVTRLPNGNFNTGPLNENTDYEISCVKPNGNTEYRIARVYVGQTPAVDVQVNSLNSDIVSIGEPFTVSWNLNNVDLASCEVVASVQYQGVDPDWINAFDNTASSGSYTNTLFEVTPANFGYTISCDASDLAEYPNPVDDTAYLDVYRDSIDLVINPNSIQINQGGDYITSPNWYSNTPYSSCDLKEVDAQGNIIAPYGGIPYQDRNVQTPLSNSILLEVSTSPTYLRLDCSSVGVTNSTPLNIDELSNIVEVTHQALDTTIILSADPCVQTAQSTTWLAWQLALSVEPLGCTLEVYELDVNNNPIMLNPLVSGQLAPPYVTGQSSITGQYSGMPVGHYTLSCINPVSNQPDINAIPVTIINGGQSCPPPTQPPGTPDPDIIFEEI
ncbi:MAG: hypothetical protein ACI88L_000214 [Candidatus Paceibacteria bacterium]|jgi:hypothetical protein